MKKSQSNRIRFNSVGVQTILRFLVSIKSFRHNKKLTFDLFAEQKTKFQKIFRGMRDFLELQCLVDDLVDFLELSIFINVSLPLNILLNEVGRQHGHGKKHFVRYHLHLFFIKKTFT